MSENGTAIHVEIDPQLQLPERYLGTGEDGPQYGPMSLYDAIIETAAEKLVKRVTTEDGLKEGYLSLVERVRRIRDEMIREAIAPVIAEALAAPLAKTNEYGETTGPETTLRELIVKKSRDQLQQSKDRYGKPLTILSQIMYDEIGSALDKELREAITEAKAEVLVTLREQGARVIADTMKKALPL